MSKLNVKDFVIDLQKNKKDNNIKKNRSTKYSYEVILENNIDFVLNKKTKTTDKNLVFLISQGVFYIKNNKTENIEKITEQKLRGFFNPIYYNGFNDFEKIQWWDWDNDSLRNNINLMIQIIETPIMQEMYKCNMFESASNCKRWENEFNKNNKLFKYCYKQIHNDKKNKYNFENILYTSVAIENEINFNNAKIFIDKLVTENIEFCIYNNYSNNNYKKIPSLVNEQNFNFIRLVEYITQDLYSQGITRFNNEILSFYIDYLNMQIGLYGKIKEKYPKHLKTEHDIIALKFNTYKQYKKDLLVFNISDKYKKLEYETKKYSIILPKTSIDIVDEGINQSHCVGSYVDRVVNGKSLILFMRNTEEIDKSLITIEVLGDVVTQVRGFGNRLPDEQEEEFLSKWAKKKELKYEPSKTILH